MEGYRHAIKTTPLAFMRSHLVPKCLRYHTPLCHGLVVSLERADPVASLDLPVM